MVSIDIRGPLSFLRVNLRDEREEILAGIEVYPVNFDGTDGAIFALLYKVSHSKIFKLVKV